MVSKATGNGSGRSKVGSDASNSRLTSRKNRSKKGQTDFGDCNSQLLQEVVARVVGEGALISFSRTLDGGALVVYVKDGAEESKDYPTSPDMLVEVLEDLHQTYQAM